MAKRKATSTDKKIEEAARKVGSALGAFVRLIEANLPGSMKPSGSTKDAPKSSAKKNARPRKPRAKKAAPKES